VRAHILAAQTKKVEEFITPEEEATLLVERIKDEMENGVSESKSDVFGEEEMDVEGDQAAALLENGQYNYGNVKRWSKKFDVFALDRVFMPVNLSNTHWTLLVAYIQRKEIHYYDSMSGSGERHMKAVLRWLTDEAREKKQMTLDPAEWKLVDREKDVPQQQNGYDCGVFSVICADYLSDSLLLRYSQEEMPDNRIKIAWAIREGKLWY
jgi:Ulp1 family protease